MQRLLTGPSFVRHLMISGRWREAWEMGSPARSDTVADCGGSDHAPSHASHPLSQPLQRGIEHRPRQRAALGTCSCQGVLSWLFGSDVSRGRLGLPLVCVHSRLKCDRCTSWHVRTAPDAAKDGGGGCRPARDFVSAQADWGKETSWALEVSPKKLIYPRPT